MSSDPTQTTAGGPGEPGGAPSEPGGAPSEEELRAAYEAELSRITVTDMIAQSAVSLLNMAARRLAPPGSGGPAAGAGQAGAGRDLEQVRDAIDGVRALLEILERRIPGEVGSLRDALSQLQMAYAAEVRAGEAGSGGAGDPGSGGSGGAPPSGGQAPEGEPGEAGQPGPGPAESSGRLWVPGR